MPCACKACCPLPLTTPKRGAGIPNCCRSVHGFAMMAPCDLYSLYSECGVAAPGLLSGDMSPPTCRQAAINSAQYQLSPVEVRGHRMERAMPVELKGLPTCCLDQCSIAAIACCEQPTWTYW